MIIDAALNGMEPDQARMFSRMPVGLAPSACLRRQSRGHGLSIGNPGRPLSETVVRPGGASDSSFAMFCKALDTPPLTEPTTLGALWAANRHLESVDGLGLGSPPTLELTVIGSTVMGGPSLYAQLGGDWAADLPAGNAAAATALGERLHEYPGASTGLVVCAQATSITAGGSEPKVEIGWLDGNGKSIPVHRIAPDGRSMPARDHRIGVPICRLRALW